MDSTARGGTKLEKSRASTVPRAEGVDPWAVFRGFLPHRDPAADWGGHAESRDVVWTGPRGTLRGRGAYRAAFELREQGTTARLARTGGLQGVL